jgi:predicted nucleotidyltransferase
MLQMETRHQEIISLILSKYPYQFYAYGSRVKNRAKKYSDLDLCFYGEIPWNILSHIQEDLEESDLPFKVDLVAWGWMSSEFQNLIKSDLILIK